jgi:hypothetical protein
MFLHCYYYLPILISMTGIYTNAATIVVRPKRRGFLRGGGGVRARGRGGQGARGQEGRLLQQPVQQRRGLRGGGRAQPLQHAAALALHIVSMPCLPHVYRLSVPCLCPVYALSVPCLCPVLLLHLSLSLCVVCLSLSLSLSLSPSLSLSVCLCVVRLSLSLSLSPSLSLSLSVVCHPPFSLSMRLFTLAF